MKCKIPATLIKMTTNNVPVLIAIAYFSIASTLGAFFIEQDHWSGGAALGFGYSIIIPILVVIVLAILWGIISDIKKFYNSRHKWSIKHHLKNNQWTYTVVLLLTIAFLVGTFFVDEGHIGIGFLFVIATLVIMAIIILASLAIVTVLRFLINEYKKACNEVNEEIK